jgi:preprotein translocase SecE subunit
MINKTAREAFLFTRLKYCWADAKYIHMTQLIKYLRATIAELRQVAWPTRREATLYTILVIAISTVIALYVGAFDYLFSQGINMLINRF